MSSEICEVVTMDLLDAIATVGFPIAAYLLVYWDLRVIVKQNTKVLNHLTELIERLNRNA